MCCCDREIVQSNIAQLTTWMNPPQSTMSLSLYLSPHSIVMLMMLSKRRKNIFNSQELFKLFKHNNNHKTHREQ